MKHHKNIFLLGFMGSGKTTLGKKLAHQLGYHFIDLDQAIEQNTGSTISEIFAAHGEAYFRDMETAELKKIVASDSTNVIALGGGTPCFNNNMEIVNHSGLSIYIKYNAGILTSRLLNAKSERPLIAGKSKEELELFVEDLLKKREGDYLKSHQIVEGNNITVNQLKDLLF